MVLLGLFLTGFAQNDPQAKKILDDVSSRVKGFKGITADFSYITKDRKNIKRNSVIGKISIKGQKYFIKQGSTEIYSDGNKSWNFNGDKEVTVSDIDNDSHTLSPQRLLTNFYDKDFTSKLVSSAGSTYQILMMPVDKRKNFKQVTVFVDKAKKLITKAQVIDKSDNKIEFDLRNVNTNAALPDSRFTFDTKKHPGVEVIEQ
ncbi:MAG: hypothetical protein JWN76_3334 [Chitinophagaceae bacterium]|nr:hypothetical protein [Chitinophagaceae bacterium]